MKYTALTIGPIIKTLMLAHRTKELWAASYFFSCFMEKIIDNIPDKSAIILPYSDKNGLITELEINANQIASAGIFPDRLLLQSEEGLYEQLKIAVGKAIRDIAEEFGMTGVVKDLEAAIYAHIIEFDYVPRNGKENDNIIFQTNDYLANCELQAKYVAEDSEVLLKMLEGIDKSGKYKKVFGNKNFPSIIEIGTHGLGLKPFFYLQDKDKAKDEEDAEIWNRIVEQGKKEKVELEKIKDEKERVEKKKGFLVHDKLKTAHKYIAIVQADGDNVGTIIKQVASQQDSGKIRSFSECLSKFSLCAAKEIDKYGGLPVYVGGDDLLFFAPVVTAEENIFNLLAKIDTVFKTEVLDKYPNLVPTPSMSYGVSISYYKYPMHEALATARNLLFTDAKEGAKNAIAFKILKHSGQHFGAVLKKPGDPTVDAFSTLLHANQKLALHSVIYNMDEHETILKEVIVDTEKLKNFFENFYNEKVHNEQRAYFEIVSLLLSQAYQECGSDFKKAKNQVYAQLRLIQFLNSKNDE
jgi:CRISPR-associated protein Cmr2